MTMRFCPDCGGECGPEDEACRDCSFPLRILLVSDRGHLRIQKSELTRWNRIAQILRRNGIKVDIRPDAAQAKYLFWWALPGMGALFFLLTLLLGGRMVDAIWPPPDPVETVVIGAKTQGSDSSEAGTTGSKPQSEVDTQFLMDALGTSEEQKLITQDLNINPEEYVDRTTLNLEEIRRLAKACLLTVTVGDNQYNGTLITNRGFFLTDVNALNGAFQRVTRTIEEGGQLTQQREFVVPKVGIIGPGKVEAEKERESQELGIALMRARLKVETLHSLDFNRDLLPAETVYVVTQNLGGIVLNERSVGEPVQKPGDVTFWVLTQGFDRDVSGAPVLSQDGVLVGIMVSAGGEELVLPMVQLREREPQIFRQLIE